jgi:hypothetical protein
MRVANPIYDVVFKFLMGDMRIAKLILSKILDQEIESLEFKPTEFRRKIGLNLTVFRIDFSAVLLQADGSRKLALIEIQKAKLPTDIMRFRKYLGGHYQDPNNVYQVDDNSEEKALPIICIYFLGHPLQHTQSPVVKVQRSYIDAANQKELAHKEEFIESLTHDSYIIQIPRLRKNAATIWKSSSVSLTKVSRHQTVGISSIWTKKPIPKNFGSSSVVFSRLLLKKMSAKQWIWKMISLAS